jgi:hypothetical protein
MEEQMDDVSNWELSETGHGGFDAMPQNDMMTA